jgi:hypothetical protein
MVPALSRMNLNMQSYFFNLSYNIVTIFGCDYRRGLDWWTDLLATYIHDSGLEAITAPSLISTLYESLQNTLSLSLL